MRSFLLFLLFCFGLSLIGLVAQCPLSGTNWQSGAAPSAGCVWVNSTTCAYFDEYSTFTGLSSAQTYRVRAQFTGGVSPYSFNLYNSSVGGSAPIAFSNGSAGPLFIDVPPGTSGTVYVKNFASGCSNIGDFCHTFSIECTSCAPTAPTQPTAGTITSMSATITFTSGNILEYGLAGFTPGTDGNAGGGIVINPATSPQIIMGLTPATAYQVYVRTLCGSTYSPNSPVRNFTTLAPPPSCPAGLGTSVSIPSLPYDSGTGQTTCGNGNNVTTTNATICGNTNYYLAEDKTYIFTPTVSGVHTITLTTVGDYDAGIMLYEGCPFLGSGGTCIAQAQATTGLIRTLSPNLSAGITYYLVLDNWTAPACMASYRLEIVAPVACPTPIGVLSNSITSNSANITWSCVGCTGTYIVEYGPPGFTPGTGATVGTGIAVVTSASSPAMLSGLDPASVYNVYVRQNCGVDGYSSNSTVHIFNTLAPPPANDNCSGATALTVNSDDLCGSVTNGTVTAATASPESQVACGGTEDDDVWFSFTATATTHTIDLLNITGSTTDMYHSLWSGSCGSLVHTGLCSDANSSTASGLSIGNTYYLRVYTWTGTAGQTSVFDVCIGTPPPPPSNDDCSGATPISDGSAISQSVTLATDDLTAPICSGIDLETQGVWFVYSVPTNYTGTITIEGCNSSYDMRVRVFEGSCGSFTCVVGDDDDDCVSPGSSLAETTTFDVDTQGAFHGGNSGSRAPKDYYVLITGAGGTLDFTVTANLVLPITISKISAHNMGKNNMVTWTTSSEVNNDVQIVERSKDGVSGWEMIGKVNGTNSRETVTYEVYDNNPNNTSFYRVHSVDFDGKEQFSKIVSVQREGRRGIITSIQPNPTANFVEIDLQPEFNDEITYSILDVTGKLLKTTVFYATNDALNLHTLEMSDLQSGLYFVSIKGGGISKNVKIFKQ